MSDAVADELAIRDLSARFNHLADERRNEELAETFAPDGVFETRGERFEGRTAIVAYLDAQKEGVPVDIGFGATGHLGSTVHVTTDNLITVDGDNATQLSYTTVFFPAPPDVVANGLLIVTERFEDNLARTGTGWLFTERVMTILQTNAGHGVTMRKAGLSADH